MKKATANLISIFLCFFALSVLAASAHAGTYFGELKWEISGGEDVKETLVTGITHTGGKYLLVQGYLDPSDGDGVIVLGGSGIVMDGKLLMTLNGSQQHTPSQWRDIQTWHAEIELSSWSGAFWVIGSSYDLDEEQHDLEDFFQGFIKLVGD